MTVAAWVGAAALGGAGAVARYRLDVAVQRRLGTELPLGTLVVNLAGSLAAGVLAGAAVVGTPLVLAGSAFLGSFTTFSTWMLESERLAEDGEAGRALPNLGGSLLAGFAAVALGWAVGRAL